MARSELRLLLAAAAVAAGSCDGHRDETGHGSITVKLPPARPQAPAPAFRFKPEDASKVGTVAD